MMDAGQYPVGYDVPSPPDSTLWDDQLRWCVFVMNKGDPQRHFAASCLSWVLKSGGLTDRQASACAKMLRRVLALYEAGALDCQAEPEAEEVADMPARKDLH